jgi:hypothetical protein
MTAPACAAISSAQAVFPEARLELPEKPKNHRSHFSVTEMAA